MFSSSDLFPLTGLSSGVIPAQAGIHNHRTTNLIATLFVRAEVASQSSLIPTGHGVWIPACAGMTGIEHTFPAITGGCADV